MLVDRSSAELEAHFARARATAKSGSPAAGATTLLHIGATRTEVLSGRGERPDTRHTLGIGANQIARTYFRHDPPTSIEIERSIDAVEDEVMRLSRQSDPQATLVGIDDGLRAWAAIAGAAMTLELVEQLFQRLASASLGARARSRACSPDARRQRPCSSCASSCITWVTRRSWCLLSRATWRLLDLRRDAPLGSRSPTGEIRKCLAEFIKPDNRSNRR